MSKKINFTEPIQRLIIGGEIGACFEPVTQKDLFQNLEFYGDASLHYRISKLIFKTKNYLDPNHYTSLRTAAEKNATLNDFFDKFGLQTFLSKPNQSYLVTNQIKGKADIVEALIGELDRSKSVIAKNLLDGIVGFLLSIGENLFNQENPHILDFGSLSKVNVPSSRTGVSPPKSSGNSISALESAKRINYPEIDKRRPQQQQNVNNTKNNGKEVRAKVSYVNNNVNHTLPIVESKRLQQQPPQQQKVIVPSNNQQPQQKKQLVQQEQKQEKTKDLQVSIIQEGEYFKPILVESKPVIIQQQQQPQQYQFAFLTPMFLEKRLVPSNGGGDVNSEPKLNF